MSEIIAPIVAVAVYFLLRRVERLGYQQGYEDGINDRRPKHKVIPPIGFRTNTDKPANNQ